MRPIAFAFLVIARDLPQAAVPAHPPAALSAAACARTSATSRLPRRWRGARSASPCTTSACRARCQDRWRRRAAPRRRRASSSRGPSRRWGKGRASPRCRSSGPARGASRGAWRTSCKPRARAVQRSASPCPGSDPRVGSPTVPRPAYQRRARLALAALSVASFATGASAVEPASGLVVSAGVGGGVELGLEGEKAGVAETELTVGWEHERTGVRPELGLGLGLAPDTHFALRPGVRWVAPELSIHLRIALDWSNARADRRWRWLLIGGAFELRWTSAFSLFAGVDLGFPVGKDAGLPLLARGGASFRF